MVGDGGSAAEVWGVCEQDGSQQQRHRSAVGWGEATHPPVPHPVVFIFNFLCTVAYQIYSKPGCG